MKLNELLTELRKNPDVSPKTKTFDELVKLIDSRGHTSDNLFLSFTALDKLGINPQSEYDTPLGIYGYPAGYVLRKTEHSKDVRDLPFAGSQAYANFFESTDPKRILHISNVEEGDYVRLIDLLKHAAVKVGRDPELEKEVVRYAEKSSYNALKSSPGGKFWYVIRAMSTIIADRISSKAPVVWNKLFRTMGYIGVVDDGDGIIHSNEPCQAVFFSIESVRLVKRMNNKYHNIEVNRVHGERTHQSLVHLGKSIKNMSPDELADYFDDNRHLLEKLKDPKIKLLVVSKYPKLFTYISNPTPEMALAAVNSPEFNIYQISGPLIKALRAGNMITPAAKLLDLAIEEQDYGVIRAIVRTFPDVVWKSNLTKISKDQLETIALSYKNYCSSPEKYKKFLMHLIRIGKVQPTQNKYSAMKPKGVYF